MPARRSGPRPLYSVYLTRYASAHIKRAVENGTARIRTPEQLTAESFYLGTSQAQAERAFSRAAMAGYRDPLGLEVAIRRDSLVLARVRVAHD